MCAAVAPLANIEIVEARLREELKDVKKNSLGSEYVAFHATESEVLALAESKLINAFRRVVLDPVRGLVMLMSPSFSHETISRDVEDFIVIAGDLQNLKVMKGGSTRWRRSTDPKNTGSEADCSFYFGQKAIDCAEAFSRSDAAADAYSVRVPPDLVVEVVVTHESKEKQLSYRDLGMPEFWQVDVQSRALGRKVTVKFLDLQAEPGPRPLVKSLNLSDMRPAYVSRAIEQFRRDRISGYDERRQVIRSLMT